jgi:hypothetical protein
VTYDVRLFAGMSAFGIGAGTAYWFLTYDPTGTVLLVLFGVAAGIAGVAELVWSRRAGRRRGDGVRGRPEHGSASDAAVGMDTGAAAGEATEPLPRPGWAPLGIALGLGAVALAAAFGPAVAVAGLILTLWGARSWLGAAVREADDARPRGAIAKRTGRVR